MVCFHFPVVLLTTNSEVESHAHSSCTVLFHLLIVCYCCCYHQALSDVYANYAANKLCGIDKEVADICKENNVAWEPNYLSLTPPGIGRYMAFLAAEGVLFFLLVLVVESDLSTWLRTRLECSFAADVGKNYGDEDEDVRRERLRVGDLDAQGRPRVAKENPDILVVRDLNKFYNPVACLPVSNSLSFMLHIIFLFLFVCVFCCPFSGACLPVMCLTLHR